MISFAALNKEDSGSITSTPVGKHSKPTKEAQESAVLQLYHAAMKKQQEGQLEEAGLMYREILDSSLIYPITPSSGPMTNTLYRVKFLILKNLASIAKERDDVPLAISAYLEASEYSKEDNTLYYQLALSSVSIGDLVLARNALEQVLQISPRYWPAVDILCKVLFAIGDYHACLELAVASLEINPQYIAAVGLIQHILVLCPEFLKTNPLLTKYLIKPRPPETDKLIADAKVLRVKYEALKDVTVLPESIVPPCKLSAVSFESLGKFLVAVYRHCQDKSRMYQRASLGVPVDLYNVLQGVTEKPPPPPEVSLDKPSAPTVPIKDVSDHGKRKRRLFSDPYFDYPPKRRSTRSRVAGLTGSVRKEQQDYHKLISQFIPPLYRLPILPEMSDLTEVPQIRQKRLNSIPVTTDVTDVIDEVEEVRRFISSEKSNSGIIALLLKFLWFLAQNYSSQWSSRGSSAIVKMFIDCFELVYQHLKFPSPFSNMNEGERKNAQQLLLISLCYTELVIDALLSSDSSINQSKKSSPSSTPLPTHLRRSMVFVQSMSLTVFDNHQERMETAVRIHWLKFRWFLVKKQSESAIFALDKCKELIHETTDVVPCQEEKPLTDDQQRPPLVVHIANCSTDNLISLDHIEEKKSSLEQMISLKNVYVMYNEGKYSEVIEGLIPILKEKQGTHSQFFLSVSTQATPTTDNQPRVQLLLESLIHTSRITECFEYCVQTLIELLSYYTTHGASDQWASALATSCGVAQKCLESDSDVFSKSSFKVVQNFITTMIKVLDLIQDSFDLIPLPELDSTVPWKLLYNMLSCDNLPEDSALSSVDDDDTLMESDEVPLSEQKANNSDAKADCKSIDPMEEEAPSIREDETQQIKDSETITMEIDVEQAEAKDSEEQYRQTATGNVNEEDNKEDSLLKEDVMDTGEKVPSSPPHTSSVAPHSAAPLGSSNSDVLTTCSIVGDSGLSLLKNITTVSPCSVSSPSLSSSHHTTPPNQDISSPIAETSSPSTVADVISSSIQSQPTHTSHPLQDIPRSSSPHVTTPPTTTTTPPLTVSCSSSRSVTVSPSVSGRGLSVGRHGPMAEYKNKKEASLRFLQLAHSQLGSFGCCTKDNGSFLHFIIKTLLSELRGLTALPKELREFLVGFFELLMMNDVCKGSSKADEILLVELEQCYYCLYGYPYKKAKSRGLLDHGADQVPLTWSGAQELLEYFHPSYLPSIDDTKSPQVTSELITLYKKIAEVVPKEGQIVDKESLLDYINGNLDTLPDPSPPSQHSSLIAEIYYLLADDALKSFDNENAIKFYKNNLAYCPDRFDSWAGLALAKVRRITDKIDQRDLRVTVEKTVQRKTPPTLRCFQRTLELNKQHCYVVEKFGFFLYAVHSFASQVMKQPSLYKSKQVQLWASQCREDMLMLAEKQFSHTLTLGGSKHSEPWIYHFMLGKIASKLKKPPETILDHFIKSTDILHSEGAAYPVTVEVASKGHAIQALEVHYHFVSTILKIILASSSDHSQFNPSILSQSISSIRYYPLGCITYHSLWSWVANIVSLYRNPSQQQKQIDKDGSQTIASKELENIQTLCPTKEKTTPQRTRTEANVDIGNGSESEQKSEIEIKTDVAATINQPSIPVLPTYITHSQSQDKSLHTNDEEASRLKMEVDDVVVSPGTATNKSSTCAQTHLTASATSVSTQSVISSELKDTSEGSLARKDSISSISNIDEEELIIVDEGSGSSSPESCHETSAIELMAQKVTAATSSDDDSPGPMPRFSAPVPDPLTESLYGVAMCAVRFPAYFKPLYRLASALNTMGFPREAKNFLLGPIPACFTEIQEKLVPIFVMKSNIYQNMWQIQVNEINRPGNFSSHARSCLELLIDVLTHLNDRSSLLFVTQQLKSKVDPSRQYMRESERQTLYVKSLKSCVEVLKRETAVTIDKCQTSTFLMEAYSVRQMVSKISESFKDELIKDTEAIMINLFTAIIKDNEEAQRWVVCEGAPDVTVDICVKYCQMKSKAN